MVLHYEYITNGTTTQLDPAKILLKYSCQSNLIQIPNKEKLATVLPGSWNNHGPLGVKIDKWLHGG